MGRVIHDNSNAWGRTIVIVVNGGYGFVMVTMPASRPGEAVIHDLMVHPSSRKGGLGRHLLELATASARDAGADTVMISAEPGSWQAGWYRRFGFEEDGLMEIEGHDCIVLSKKITRREAEEPQKFH